VHKNTAANSAIRVGYTELFLVAMHYALTA